MLVLGMYFPFFYFGGTDQIGIALRALAGKVLEMIWRVDRFAVVSSC